VTNRCIFGALLTFFPAIKQQPLRLQFITNVSIGTILPDVTERQSQIVRKRHFFQMGTLNPNVYCKVSLPSMKVIFSILKTKKTTASLCYISLTTLNIRIYKEMDTIFVESETYHPWW